MNLKQSQILNRTYLGPATTAAGIINAKSSAIKKVLASSLTLTSLVDCFTILVVYLLVATSFGSQELNMPKDMILPDAQYSTALAAGTVIRVEEGKYTVNDKSVSLEMLSEILQSTRGTSDSVVIQADKRADYSLLNPVVLASLQAGFTKIKFAVLQGDRG